MCSHPVAKLRQRMDEVIPASEYPLAVVCPVRTPIAGTAFFPGGHGLWMEGIGVGLPAFPLAKVMILGQDFHSEARYRISFQNGKEDLENFTWGNLRRLLQSVGIGESSCFFTNAYMGLRCGGRASGPFPGAKNKYAHFAACCRAFLDEQIAAQRPRLILALGVCVTKAIAPLSPDLKVWAGAMTFQKIDGAGPLVANARFPKSANHSATVAALVHPSMRQRNVAVRRYRDYEGDAAERALLSDALEISDL